MGDGETQKRTKADIYVRVANSDGDLQPQRRAAEEYAADQGYRVVQVYEDLGVPSNTSPEGRPGFRSLMEDARMGEFSVVVVPEYGKLSTDFHTAMATAERLQGLGVLRVESVGEQMVAELREMGMIGGPFPTAKVRSGGNSSMGVVIPFDPERRRKRT